MKYQCWNCGLVVDPSDVRKNDANELPVTYHWGCGGRCDPIAEDQCTGASAYWCPIHGDCTCPRQDHRDCDFDDRNCPLHGDASKHAPQDCEPDFSRWAPLATTTNSGKVKFVCLCCGRISIARDKTCPTPAMVVLGGDTNEVNCAVWEQYEAEKRRTT